MTLTEIRLDVLRAQRIKLKIMICLFGLILCSLRSSAQAPTSPEKTSEKAAASSLKKSLLVPGWGQLAEKRYIEGALFISAEAISLYQIFSNNHKGNFYYGKYKKAINTADAVKFRELTEKYDKKRNIYILAAAGVWVLNLMDIYWIVKKRENSKIKLSIQSGQDQKLELAISYTF